MNRIRLSVVDDHPVVCMGLMLMLKHHKGQPIELVNRYVNGKQVIEDLANLNTDVFLIDMCLPDILGYELAKRVLEVHPGIKIGIYTYRVDKEYVLNSFNCGVLGYILKSASAAEITDYILTIGRGEKYIRGFVADIFLTQERILRKCEELNITKREYEILQLILSGRRNREIADRLSIAERTVEFHKQNLYLKMEVSSSLELYKAAQQFNLSLEETPLW